MESKKRKLPDWMTSPKKSEDQINCQESSGSDSSEEGKPVVYIMSPTELEEIALSILSEKKESSQ